MSLTPEQRQRIEENRKLAIQKRLQKQGPKLVDLPENGSCSKPKTFPAQNRKIPGCSSPGGLPKPPPFRPPAAENQSKLITGSNKAGTDMKAKSWLVTTEPLSGTVSLISKDRFTADIAYNQKVIDIFKLIDGRQYGNFIQTFFFLRNYFPRISGSSF